MLVGLSGILFRKVHIGHYGCTRIAYCLKRLVEAIEVLHFKMMRIGRVLFVSLILVVLSKFFRKYSL